MTLSFPTRPYTDAPSDPTLGQPIPAMPCRCPEPVIEDTDSCVACGHWTWETISQCWADRARVVAGGCEVDDASDYPDGGLRRAA